MSDRLQELRIVDPVLTTLARGYSNAKFVAESLFPIAPVDQEGGKIPQFGKEQFKLYKTERAIRAKSNRISPEGLTTIEYALTEHDEEYPMDYREESASMFNLERHGTMVVTETIQLGREKAAADLAQNADNYPVGNKITLSGTSQFTHADSDPITVIETAKEALRGKIGKRPNTMIMGAATYKALKNHATLIERIKYSMKGILTIDLMKEIFDVANIVVGEAVYASDDGVFADVWGDNVILAWVPENPGGAERSVYEPSFGYTLRKRNMPQVDKYTENGGKVRVVRSTDMYQVKMVGAESGYLIADTNG